MVRRNSVYISLKLILPSFSIRRAVPPVAIRNIGFVGVCFVTPGPGEHCEVLRAGNATHRVDEIILKTCPKISATWSAISSSFFRRRWEMSSKTGLGSSGLESVIDGIDTATSDSTICDICCFITSTSSFDSARVLALI